MIQEPSEHDNPRRNATRRQQRSGQSARPATATSRISRFLPSTSSSRPPFYVAVFGWTIRHPETGSASFDDQSGDLIGRWVTGRRIAHDPGILPFIYVDRIDETAARVAAHGGEIVKPPYPEGDLWVATFRDPAGNMLGFWQAGPRA